MIYGIDSVGIGFGRRLMELSRNHGEETRDPATERARKLERKGAGFCVGVRCLYLLDVGQHTPHMTAAPIALWPPVVFINNLKRGFLIPTTGASRE
jgi:hypothetical protein